MVYGKVLWSLNYLSSSNKPISQKHILRICLYSMEYSKPGPFQFYKLRALFSFYTLHKIHSRFSENHGERTESKWWKVKGREIFQFRLKLLKQREEERVLAFQYLVGIRINIHTPDYWSLENNRLKDPAVLKL